MGDGDDISQLAAAFAKIKQSPLALVFAIGLFAGGSGANLLDVIKPPRDDPFTGTMGAAERDARIAADDALARVFETERKERERSYFEFSEKLRLLEKKYDGISSSVIEHNRQAEKWIEKITQLEKDAHRHIK